MFNRVSIFLIAALLSTTAVAGCKKDGSSEATCEDVGKNLIELAKKELAGKDVPEEMKKMAEPMLAEAEKEAVKECKEKNWSQEAITCAATAKSEEDMATCEKLINESRQDAPAVVPPPTEPAAEMPAAEEPAEIPAAEEPAE